MLCPVLGLRPALAATLETEKLPNPNREKYQEYQDYRIDRILYNRRKI